MIKMIVNERSIDGKKVIALAKSMESLLIRKNDYTLEELATAYSLMLIKAGHDIPVNNETHKYVNMIERFECGFSLALDEKHGLDELQVKIERGDKQILSDIELMQELSHGLRHGLLKITKERDVL